MSQFSRIVDLWVDTVVDWLEKPIEGSAEPRKTLASRIDTAFRDPTTRGYGNDYLSAVRKNLEDLSRDMRRFQFLTLVIAVIFELISRTAVQNVQVGPVQVSDLSLIQKALPIIFSFTLHQMVYLNLSGVLLGRVHDELIRNLYPSLKEQEVQGFLLVAGSPLHDVRIQRANTRLRVMLRLFTVIAGLGILGASAIVGLYMIVTLFITYGWGDWLVWCSTAISAVIAFHGLLLFLYTLSMVRREHPRRDF
jgi:hypothetical protein